MPNLTQDKFIPRYARICAALRTSIFAGKLTGLVPSENELAQEYKVSRMTARKAIEELTQEGLLCREIGKGTFVANRERMGTPTGVIAFLLNSCIRGGIGNPFYAQLIQAVESECAGKSHAVIYSSSVAALLPQAGTRKNRAVRRKVDGVIAVAWSQCEELDRVRSTLPLVLIDCTTDYTDVPLVTANDEPGACAATKHLIDLGHRRIAHLGSCFGSDPGRHRRDGYLRALSEAGLQPDPSLIHEALWEFEDGYAGAQAILQRRPDATAFFCSVDSVALGAMKYLHETGRHVPDDVSVVGFGGTATAELVSPGLTTVDIPKEDLGRKALELLMEQLQGERSPKNHVVKVETRLIVRGSTKKIGN
jgi:DNA-binding LacI/PurR family transcriptional regulator